MKLIVGLGNPGQEYQNTRHNAGFMVVQRLAERRGAAAGDGGMRSKFHAALREQVIEGQKCLLMQPMTFMNRSGLAVGEAVRFYKLPLTDLLVVVDDLALPCGRVRLRSGGGGGGHNGLKDIERVLGTNRWPRLRIGIDAKRGQSQIGYVLGKFSPEQLERLEPALETACQAIECWVRDGIDKAMSLYNSVGDDSASAGDAALGGSPAAEAEGSGEA